MANGNSIELQVNLGLNAALTLIEALRKALTEAVKVDSTAFKSIDTALSGAIRLVTKLRSEMNNAFKTSAGSSKFLKEYDKLFETLGSIGDRFGFLKESEMIFSPDAAKLLGTYREELKSLQLDIELIESGKIGKIFDDSSVEGFKAVRDAASELKVNLENTTFNTFKTKLSDAMVNVQNEIAETLKALDSLKAAANSTTLNKDSILSAFTSNNVGEGALSSLISDSVSAKKLRDLITEAYKEFGIAADSKSLGNSVRANSNIANIFADLEKAVTDAAEKLKGTLNQKKGEITVAWNELVKMRDTNRDASGNIVNWEEKLAKVEEIRNKFSELNISMPSEATATTGKGIKAYLDLVILDLIDGANNLKIEDFLKALLDKIAEAINGATTKDVITDTKKFSDLVTTALTDIFGNVNFNLDFSKFKGSTLEDAFSSIIASVQAKLKNTDTLDLENKLLALKEKFNLLNLVEQSVNKAESDSSSGFENKKQRVEELTEAISSLLGVEAGVIRTKIAEALGQDGDAANNARTKIESYVASLTKLEGKLKSLSNVLSAVTRWMGFYLVLNLTKRAINEMKLHIQELDSVMTKIAVVTNMTTNDLWNLIGVYSEIARSYGVAIKGVYEISQIYYQLGLNQADVMTLTTETLKMARIAGIDYALAADYMTTAIRGFKLEMSDAAHVTDVFSNLAAHTASSTEELATAISKTAASAASVGSSFEATSAMMATMIATTRESATNIGTALKSIISRYGELKKNMSGTDAEGEEYSLNKVDTALLSVGISIHDAAGQFRDFDDVILELAKAWDGIDKNTQRYIATVMAGNRQQSRFLALVSNVEEYERALQLANDSANAGDIQTLKTLDSIDAKIEKMKVTVQEFYTSSGLQDLYKGILDSITNVMSAANSLDKTFGKIPAKALLIGASIVNVIKNVLKLIISSAQAGLEQMKTHTTNLFLSLTGKAREAGEEHGKLYSLGWKKGTQGLGQDTFKSLATLAGLYLGSALLVAGSVLTLLGLNAYGASLSKDEDEAAGRLTRTGALLSIGGSVLSGAAIGSVGGLVGSALGGLGGLITGLISNYASLSAASEMLNVSLAREIELKLKAVAAAQTELTTALGTTSNLLSAYEKLSQLKDASYDSSEAMAEYKEYMNQLADSYPYLISRIEITGDKTIELADLEQLLADSRVKSALATLNVLKAEQEEKSLEAKAFGLLYADTTSALNPQGGGLGAYSTSNLTTLMHSQGYYGSAYDLYDSLVGLGKIKGRLILVSGYERTSTNTATKYQAELKRLYQYLSDQVTEIAYDNSKEVYKNAVKNILESDSSLSIMNITGNDAILSIDDIDKLNTQDLITAMKHTQERALQYMNVAVNEVHNLDNAVADAELQLSISSNLAANVLTDTLDYSKYTSLISGLITALHGIDWTKKASTDDINAAIDSWKEWIRLNEESAQWLMTSFDTSNYKSEEDMRTALTNKNVPSEIIDKYIDDWTKYIATLQSDLLYTLLNTLTSANAKETSAIWKALFDNSQLQVNGLIVSTFQTLLVKYKSLIKQGFTAEAHNLLMTLADTYGKIAELTSDLQTAINPIIAAIDFSDKESIDTAVDALKELDPDIYGDLIKALNTSALRLTINIETNVALAREKAKDISKELESGLDNLNKGLKLSEAIESFDKFIDAYKGDETFTFNDVYTWSDSLNGYVLSVKGISLWIENTTKESTEKIDELSEQLNETIGIYSSIFSNGTSFSDADLEAQETLIKDWLRQNIYKEKDSEGNYLVSDEELIAKAGAYTAEFEALSKEYQKAVENGETQSWEEWIKNKSETLKAATEADIEFLNNLPKNTILSKLVSFDFSSIAAGNGDKSKANLQVLLLNILGENYTDNLFDTIWTELLEGKFTTLELQLKGTGFSISSSTKDSAIESNIKLYTTALNEILNLTSDHWSKETIKLISQIHPAKSKENLTDIDWLNETIDAILAELANKIDGINYTVEQYNQDIIAINEKRGLGQFKRSIDLLSNGFNLTDFASYLKTLGIEVEGKIDDYFDFTTSSWIKEINGVDLNSIITYDELTDTFKINTSKTFEEVKNDIIAAFKVTEDKARELYLTTLNNEIDDTINTLNTNDSGKRAATAISKIASGKVGERINIEGLSADIQKSLDGNADNIYEITSEYERDNWILALDAAAILDEEYRRQVLSALKAIRASRKLSDLLTPIISKIVSLSDATEYIASIEGVDADSLTDEYVQAQMEAQGYIWDAFSQEFRATEATLDYYTLLIADAETNGASAEYINQLREEANKIALLLKENPAETALMNLLSNYSNVSDEALATFKTYFSDTVNIDDFITEANGIKTIDIVALLKVIGSEWSSYFDDAINELADQYIENVSKASSLVTQGTTSLTEMAAFLEAYKKLTGFDMDFVYDPLLDSWTMTIELMQTYLIRAANKIEFATPKDRQDWIQAQIDAITVDVIDFSSFIDGTITSRGKSLLKRNLENYVKTHLPDVYSLWPAEDQQEYLETEVDRILSNIAGGGQAAVDLLKAIKPEATVDEQLAAFEAQIAPIKAVADTLDSIEVNSFVTDELIDILTKAGFTIEGNRVVAVATDMAEAYRSLYEQMAETGEATASALNAIAASGLEAKYTNAKTASENLSKGVISLTELVDMYSAAGKTFGTEITKTIDGEEVTTLDYDSELQRLLDAGLIDVDALGNVIIKDFAGMAAELAWEAGTLEYEEAYHAYLDAQITENEKHNKGQLMASTIDALASATAGQQVNVSYLTDEMLNAIGATDGLLTIASEYQRDSILLLLESYIDSYTGEGKEALQATYEAISQSITENRDAFTGLSGIVSQRVSKESAKAFVESIGWKGSEENISRIMTANGYVYDSIAKEWIATEDTLSAIYHRIDNLSKKTDALSQEKLRELLAQAQLLEYDLSSGRQQDAILAAVESYLNLSYEAFAELENSLGMELDNFVKDNGYGGLQVDTTELIRFLEASGIKISDTIKTALLGIADNYMSAITTAVSLVSSGTTSMADMDAFVLSYNKLFEGENKTIADLFSWNDVLKAWTLEPSVILKYVQGLAEQLVKAGKLSRDEVNKWITEQTTKVFAENVDISSYLSAEDPNAEREKLVEAMTLYYKSYGKSQEEINKYITNDIKSLDAGGAAAVEVVKKWAAAQGRKATDDEIAEAFEHTAQQLTDAIDELEDLTVGQITTGKLREHLARLGKVDADGVVTSVEDMTDVYISIYEEMKHTAGTTLSSLNSTLAKILTEQDKSRTDALETLEDAAGMTYDAFFTLLESYNKNVEEVLQNADKYGILRTGFGTIRIIDFDQFALEMGWDINSPEYASTYSDWVDSMIELLSTPQTMMQNMADELTALTESKVGQHLNVSYLDKAFKDLKEIEENGIDKNLSDIVEAYGAKLENGILTITAETDVDGMIAEIANTAAEAGILLPEQLAELADAVSDLLTSITDIIKNGISGGLSNTDALSIQEWANKNGIGEVNFERTAEGLRLTKDSALELYNAMKLVDTFKAKELFDELYDNYTTLSDYYKSSTTNMNRVAELQAKVSTVSGYLRTSGNVDLIAHAGHLISQESMKNAGWNEFDGDYATLYTSTYSGDEYQKNIVLNITPITNDGRQILSPEDLDNYVADLMSKSSSADEILLNDTKGLVSGAWDVDTSNAEELARAIDDASNAAANLSEESAELSEQIADWDEPSDARIKLYEEELSLAREILQVRSTTEDDSYNFMDNDIPGAQNNPINYLSSWSDAFSAINNAVEDGNMMDYTDFYNIITEMGNLADSTGEIVLDGNTILHNSEEAARLIEQGAAALSVASDGTIKVDLSKIGIDFSSGSEELKESVNAGIKDLAATEIDILDSMIQLLEAIVAMEQLGDIDVEGNGIDFNDFFKITGYDAEGNAIRDWETFSEDYLTYIDYIKDRIDENSDNYNEDLANYYKNTVLKTSSGQEVSMSDIINWTPSDFTNEANRDVVDMYAAVLQAYKEAAESNNWDEDHIMDSITSILGGKDIEGEVEISGMTLSFHSGAVILKKGDNEYVWLGHTYTSLDAATNAYKTAEFAAILGEAAKYNKDTGDIEMVAIDNINGGKVEIAVSYDIDNTSLPYTAKFSDGGVVTSDSAAGLSAAIKHYAYMQKLTLDETEAAAEETGDTLTYSITREGELTVDWKVNVKTGEVTITGVDGTEVDGSETPLTEKMSQTFEAQTTASEDYVYDVTADTELAEKDLDEVDQKADKINDKKTEVEVDTKEAQENIEDVTKKAEELEGKSPIDVDVTVDANEEGIQGFERMAQAADNLDEEHPTIEVTVDPENKVEKELIPALTEIINKLSSLPLPLPTVDLNVDEVSGLVTTILGLINSIQGTSVTVDVSYNDPGMPGGGSSGNGGSGSGGCFVAGTQIIMADQSTKNIEDILIGDEVIAYNDETGVFEIRKVIKSYPHYNTPRVLEITLSSGIVLGITPGHPLLTTKGWKSRDIANSRWEHNTIADWLNVGDEIIGYYGNEKVVNIKELNIPKNYTTYNIEVEICHTFMVEGLVVHNAKSATAYGTIGNAKASGSTLMGELGPELVVSNGRYFVAGLNGAEFVDLADDAIVFNHLQTQLLLKNGTSKTRGNAITNERNAVAFAKGSVHGGPAMSSASAALATLRQLRAEWQAIYNMSTSDLANLGGGGSSGGGGGSGDSAAARASFLADVERWYNWLLKIDQLEKDINYEETKRSKIQSQMIADGKSYAESNLKSLELLKEQAVTHKALADTQKEYFEKRRAELNSGAFSDLYTFDENGQLKYNDDIVINGNKGAFAFLSDLMAVNDYGEPKYSSEELYNILVSAGYGDYMKYDSSGTEIQYDEDSDDNSSFYSSSVEAFWDVIDNQKEEMQSLHDSIIEYEEAVLEDQEAANEILKEIEDNLISVEERVFNALVDKLQRAIDELQNERDAIEESAQAVIDGLSNLLAKEREMYNTLENQDELTSLQRQLNILQRSGGSAAQIASLLKEISSKLKDAYFEAQQALIDALQEASDNELERLDLLIDLMTETLAYLKDNGLLWEEVYEQMLKSPEEIADYIFANDSSLWGSSPTKTTQDYREALFEALQFVTYRDNITDGLDKLAETFSDYAIALAAKEEEENSKIDTYVNSDSGSGSSSSSSSSSSSGGSSSSTTSSGGSSTNKNNSNSIASALVSGIKTGATAVASSAKTPTNEYATRITGKTSTGETVSKTITTKSETLANNWIKLGKAVMSKFDEGGMIDKDQIAFVHAKESVLTPQQTETLRNDILSNKPTSLLNLLMDFRDAYNGIPGASDYSAINNSNNGISIGQATVEMHVDKINNDYDAQRAGEQALEKMLSIARKTSGQNRIGR